MKKSGRKTSSFGRKIIISIIVILIVLIFCVLFMGHSYLKASLKPLNSNNHSKIQIDVPMGASDRKIGSILQNQNIVRSGMVFNYYVKAHNISDFRAGYYELSPSMSLQQIANILRRGGSSLPLKTSYGKIVVSEGSSINQLANNVQNNSRFSSTNFIDLMKNRNFANQLKKKYPELLTSSMKSKRTRYPLEGYLYPAVYSADNGISMEQMVESMVSKENGALKPYYSRMKKEHLSVQQTLTLASLIEKQNLNSERNRELVAGILLNRIDNKMHLNSDTSVLYALNKFKRKLNQKDLKNNSPYNLYKYIGYGPGPFNNPGLNSIKAVLYPKKRDQGYLYFIVNPKNGKLLLAKNSLEQQNNAKKVSK
ncbi:endolytic transglycosylase MltG [Philodulcilactobacillus myokoensis]|nr:endolytic transglycosylase MltG [Philodulcilactobacillus myokoensis]